MHDTATMTGRAFFACYGSMGQKVLDVGSRDLNGTLRPFAPTNAEYVGIDVEDGLGVDVILDDPYIFPFTDDSFDLVVSTSCFEHDSMFWLTFVEMMRVVRPGGFIYVSAPTNGPVHRHPVDCWRFYPDAAQALMTWAIRNGLEAVLVETLQMLPRTDKWIDFVAVWSKGRFNMPRELMIDYLARVS